MKHQFVHQFEDDPFLSDFEIDLDPPSAGRIRFEVDGKDIWLSANRVGWLHLARVCAEMGLHSKFKPGYHIHRSFDLSDSSAPLQRVTFELADEGAA